MATCRVVIADDAPDIRSLIRSVLEGHEDLEIVGEATDGAEAIEVTERLKPTVILLDLSMPNMDGLEALPRIADVSPETAIIVLSGFLSPDVRQRVMAMGATRCVEKGVHIDELLEAVREVCNACEGLAESGAADVAG